jgi:hypothetical protein
MPQRAVAAMALAKRMVDWNQVLIGEVHEARLDPATGAVKALVVDVREEAQALMPVPASRLVVPVSMLFGIRGDEVAIDRPLGDVYGHFVPSDAGRGL